MWIDLKSKFLKLWAKNGFSGLVAWAEWGFCLLFSGLWWVPTFSSEMTPRLRMSWIHRCLSSICFDFLEMPRREAIVFLLKNRLWQWSSRFLTSLEGIAVLHSWMKCLIASDSTAAWVIAYNSASVDEWDIDACVLLSEAMLTENMSQEAASVQRFFQEIQKVFSLKHIDYLTSEHPVEFLGRVIKKRRSGQSTMELSQKFIDNLLGLFDITSRVTTNGWLSLSRKRIRSHVAKSIIHCSEQQLANCCRWKNS